MVCWILWLTYWQVFQRSLIMAYGYKLVDIWSGLSNLFICTPSDLRQPQSRFECLCEVQYSNHFTTRFGNIWYTLCCEPLFGCIFMCPLAHRVHFWNRCLHSLANLECNVQSIGIRTSILKEFCLKSSHVVSLFSRLGISQKPKLHFLLHLARNISAQGSPGYSACWHDESLNQRLKRVALRSHRSVWYKRILVEMESLSVRGLKRVANFWCCCWIVVPPLAKHAFVCRPELSLPQSSPRVDN